ncbi:MAG: T9SS type A sorting domain-containing protein [Crocinitomicaceae bacterium]|nr:T9SS type A sorting domain-containing protein [Crocinitomicaceae bacterium]
MKILLVFLLPLFPLFSNSFLAISQSSINGSFDFDGLTRTYSFYVPASYNPNTPTPLVIGLHGTGSSGAEFEQYRDFRPIADTANFIMVNPDGSTMFGLKFWNYENILGSTVDDIGFLEALIDTISNHYNINQNRVYATGMSNGSFMCYALACQTNRFAAIGTVTGSMSVNMYNNCNPSHFTPRLHIHGTDDTTNPYAGTTTMAGIDDANLFWVNHNQCDTTPTIFNISDINSSDGATATRYLYTGGINGNTVELFKINGGGHTWPGGPIPGATAITCMDFNASSEIWRFFSQYELNPTASLEENKDYEFSIWPNPSHSIFYLKSKTNQKITQVQLYSLSGKLVLEKHASDISNFSCSTIESGSYILKVKIDQEYLVKRVIID